MKDLSMASSTAVLLVAFGMGLNLPGAQAASPFDLVVNGDFETGNFVGWNVVPGAFLANYHMNDGTYVPSSPGGPLPPINGDFDAVGDQEGASVTRLQQTVNIPPGIFSGRLSWNDRIRNFAAIFLDPGQEYRVLITDLDGVLLQEVFSTNPGDPLLQIGPNSRSGDVTGILQDFAGEDVVVSIETQAQFVFHTVTVDDVKLLVSILPTTINDCQGGEWQTFVNVNTGAQIFKNQGDCVSFVATAGRDSPSGF